MLALGFSRRWERPKLMPNALRIPLDSRLERALRKNQMALSTVALEG